MITINDFEKELDQTSDVKSDKKIRSRFERIGKYLRGCIDPNNARLYGNFQERAALNTTQFHKIQGSLLIRMGMVYPIMSYLTEKMGIPKDCSTDLFGMAINYHTWIAGYLAYLTEIQLGLSKYPMELIGNSFKKIKYYFADENPAHPQKPHI